MKPDVVFFATAAPSLERAKTRSGHGVCVVNGE